MIRITDKQRATIVRLFIGGATIDNLAMSYGVSYVRVQEIIREALLRMSKSEDL